MCPVNSQNEEKLAGQGEARLRLLTNATYPRWTCISPFSVRLSEAYTVVPNMRSTIIVQLHEEAKCQVQGLVVRVVLLLEPHGGASVFFFFISDKVHVYSGEGWKTAAQHVMNDIDQPTMLEYILASVRARLCVLATRLSQGTMDCPFCRQLRSVCSHLSHM